MVVIKKSNEEQPFSIEKLALSIKAANMNTDEPLDVELVVAEFRSIIVDNDYITTGQIAVVVYGLLYSKGAFKTLYNFAKYKELAEHSGGESL